MLVFVGVGKLILERDSDQIIMRTLKLYYADPNEEYEFINEEGGRIAEYLNEIRLLSPPFNFILDDKGLFVESYTCKDDPNSSPYININGNMNIRISG